jgi:hypothetical protein
VLTHKSGGGWTEQKLKILDNYSVAYCRIFQINPGAKHFDTIDVDAFAGTGLVTQRKDAAKGAKLVANPDGALDR